MLLIMLLIVKWAPPPRLLEAIPSICHLMRSVAVLAQAYDARSVSSIVKDSKLIMAEVLREGRFLDRVCVILA